MIPSVLGLFVCILSLGIRSISGYDVLLGHDWLQHCGVRVDAQGVSDPPPGICQYLPVDVQCVSGPICGLVHKCTLCSFGVSVYVS